MANNAAEYTESDTLKGIWDTLGDIPLTEAEAVRAVRKLYRFALGALPDEVNITKRNADHSYVWKHVGNDVHAVFNINPKRVEAWRALVWMMGCACSEIYQRERGGDSWRNTDKMRMRMTHELIKRGWLGGVLADAPKPKPTLDDKRQARLKRIDVLVANWQRKQKRAATAIRKLQQERKRIERRLAS